MLMLAGLGALLASVYWAGMTLLILVGTLAGSTSIVQLILPVILIGLYAVRAVQMLRGDLGAARSILFLHAFGGLMAVMSMAGGGIIVVLQGIKLLIHIFGGVTAFLATR